ncbi:MAG: YggT family protein [Caldilineaceae bacterium]
MSIFALLATLINFYSILIFIRVLLTWIPNIDPYNPAVQALERITDPVLEQARRIIPPIGMVDISSMVVLIVLYVLSNILNSLA